MTIDPYDEQERQLRRENAEGGVKGTSMPNLTFSEQLALSNDEFWNWIATQPATADVDDPAIFCEHGVEWQHSCRSCGRNFDCPHCHGTGYLPQPKELDRWHSPQRCECHPAYVAETERLRAYS